MGKTTFDKTLTFTKCREISRKQRQTERETVTIVTERERKREIRTEKKSLG